MDRDPGILCFNHCGPRVFCFQLPEYCPACRTPMEEVTNLLPFRVPYPFVRASQHPCSILIKPTNGDFLHDYKVSMDLHIGATSGEGKVLEFDRGGLHRDRTAAWDECLLVYRAGDNEEIAELWDPVLASIANQECWVPARYNEESFNCYSFVLEFIKCLRAGVISGIAANKTTFCEIFVSPRVTVACKYINLYRRLKDSGYYVCRGQDGHR